MYMVNQDQYNILQKITNPPAQITVPMNIPSTAVSESLPQSGSESLIPISSPAQTFRCAICSKSFDKF